MKYTKHTLPNGLRVILVPDEQALAATVLVMVEAGSNYETKELNGLSHFLEHMCFKGTERRPRAGDISAELDGLGAQYNAFTTNEFTGYYAKVQSKFFDRALDIVADMYLNPRLDQKEIETERGVIIEEINMYEDLPQRRVQELIAEALYGDQPCGWEIAGKKENVLAMKRDDFVNYRTRLYTAPATIVVCAGKFDESSALSQVEKYFSAISSAPKGVRPTVTEKQNAPVSLYKDKDSDQTHLIVAARGVHSSHPDLYIYEVMSSVLGGGMSSRLFQKVRDQMGAAYYVRSATEAHSNYGYLSAWAGADNKRADQVITAICDEFKRLKTEPVSAEELTKTKDMLQGKLFLSLETPHDMAEFVAGQEIEKGKIDSPEEVAKKIQSVQAEDILRVAREIFVPEKLNLALIGPGDKKRFAPLLSV